MSKDTASLSTPIQPLTLEEVAAHFEHWRSEKKKGERIPEQLWSEAIALVKDYGLSPVTRRLRLSGRDLNKRRGILGSGQRRRRVEPPTTFVELAPEVVVQAQRRQSTAGCLELIRPDGLRLRIEPGEGIDAHAVLERFMEVG
ncbi:MAG: hypothetical protein WBG92_05760 [Thiohalocapsa sp.]